MQTSITSSPLAYNPVESWDEFCNRKHSALEAGRLAVRERRIKAHIYLFYEAIIDRVGGNKYTWVGEETWAAEFHVDESTIKRWIAKLVHVRLIRRQRRFGTSSCTYITAYDRRTVVLDGAAAVDQHRPQDQDHAEAKQDTPEAQGSGAVAQSTPAEDQGRASDDLSLRRNHAPTISAHLRRDPVNVEHRILGGGGVGNRYKHSLVPPEVIRLLEQECVNGFFVAPTLRQKSVAELKAVSDYLDKQQNVRARDKLFAALVLQDFGAQLLAGRVSSQVQRAAKPQRNAACTSSTPDEHLKYVSGSLAPYIQGGPPVADPVPGVSEPGLRRTDQAEPSSSMLAQTWQQVLDSLRQALPASEFTTWFDETTLIEVIDDQAVVSVRNIFAREKLTDCYQAQIAQALQVSCGRSMQVQIVIGR